MLQIQQVSGIQSLIEEQDMPQRKRSKSLTQSRIQQHHLTYDLLAKD